MNVATVVTVVTMSPSALTDFLPLFWLCLLHAILGRALAQRLNILFMEHVKSE